ncbi:hypothetical protein TNCT_319231 [Trichonephila clavata]|uniref:HD domain-containing protein n=1 Tax=Trichonephila clavata TaxID=2740835 RepID=A0A8X6M415_TRICU|nr:hypothetical protein TNCT_319231 [Trichonephila clavata]
MDSSSDFVSEFKRVLSLIYPPYDFPDVYWRIFNFNWFPNPIIKNAFKSTVWMFARRMDALCHRDNLLQEIWKEEITFAYLVGFLHDIGKPFVTRMNFFGTTRFSEVTLKWVLVC